MNEWYEMIKLGEKELSELPLGARVQWRRLNQPIGTVVQHSPPLGLLSPMVKVIWDDGQESEFLYIGELKRV